MTSSASRASCSGSMLLAAIVVLMLVSVLAAGILSIISRGIEDAAGSTAVLRAVCAAEAGSSLAKAYCRSNSLWTSAVPFTIQGVLDGSEYSAMVTTSPASMNISTTIVWLGAEPLSWTGTVSDGWSCIDAAALSTAALLPFIQSDNGDGASARKCGADRSDTIAGLKWFSAYFSNDFPVAATSIVSASIFLDHEGRNKKAGNLVVHVSSNRTATGWFTGGTGASHSNSGDVAWNDTEQRYELDVTGLLSSAGRINNCEVLVLNRAASSSAVYFDYMYMTAEYLIPPTPLVIVSTSSVQYAVVTSTGRHGDAEWTSEWAGPGASKWQSEVIDGWACSRSKTLSQAGYLPFIRSDDGDAASARKCLSSQGDNITDENWFSVYFNGDLPQDISSVSRARIYIDHQGRAGQSGLLRVHVSTNRTLTGWFQGGTNVSDAVSGDVAWNDVEQRYEYDVTDILRSADAVNNCEVLIVDRQSSTDAVYFDYIFIDVEYY